MINEKAARFPKKSPLAFAVSGNMRTFAVEISGNDAERIPYHAFEEE